MLHEVNFSKFRMNGHWRRLCEELGTVVGRGFGERGENPKTGKVVCLPMAWVQEPDQVFGFVLSAEAVAELDKYLKNRGDTVRDWCVKLKLQPQSDDVELRDSSRTSSLPVNLKEEIEAAGGSGDGALVVYPGIQREQRERFGGVERTLIGAGLLPIEADRAEKLLVSTWRGGQNTRL